MYASTARPSERKDLAASWNLNVRLAISIQNSSTLQLPLTDKVNVIYGTFDREGEVVRLIHAFRKLKFVLLNARIRWQCVKGTGRKSSRLRSVFQGAPALEAPEVIPHEATEATSFSH